MAGLQRVGDIYPKEWLTPEDLAGKSVTVEIMSVEIREFFNPQTRQKATKPVIAFKGAKRKLVANKTQSYRIAEIVGTDIFAQWPGHKITLSQARTNNGKDTIAIQGTAGSSPKAQEHAIPTQEQALPVEQEQELPEHAQDEEDTDDLWR